MEAVGTLTGGIAHDFNNILTAIIGYGHILKMKLEQESPLMAYTDQILASAERAAQPHTKPPCIQQKTGNQSKTRKPQRDNGKRRENTS